jgi:UDP-N-acetylglucosamine 1-carboxyvinyltransferase
MSKYIITGGKPLSGEVSIRGAKNASFKEIIASLLSDQPSTITNIPQISDVKITQSIAVSLGSQIETYGQHGIKIHTPKITNTVIPQGTGQKSRTCFMFLAPLLARNGSITFPFPGGDKIGTRPLDRLLTALEQMNVKVNLTASKINLKTNQLKPIEYTFPKPSHTVTEILVMLASLTLGHTKLNNAALEPEIDDLIFMLNSMGAKIVRNKDTPSTIDIDGVSRLNGTSHQVISDRNEAVTFACAALATKGEVNILKIQPHTIKTFLDTINLMGAQAIIGKDEVYIKWVKQLKAINITTGPEPSFMTDWQPVFSLVLSQAIGCSQLIETVFPNRFQHIKILNLMGVKTSFFKPTVNDPDTFYQFNTENDTLDLFHGVKIYGPSKLIPAKITIGDLRAGATATLAAISANGVSEISGVEYIKRGYENLDGRLQYLGADIKYIKK